MYKSQILQRAESVFTESAKKAAEIATDIDMKDSDFAAFCQCISSGAVSKLLMEAGEDDHLLNNLLYYVGKLNINTIFIPEDCAYHHDKSKTIAAAFGELDRTFYSYDAETAKYRAPLYHALNAVLDDESGNMFKLYWKKHPHYHNQIVDMIGRHYCELLILH